MPQRRRAMRLGIPVRIVYQTAAGRQGVMNSRNISRQGLRFMTDKTLPVGEPLELGLFLPWEVAAIPAAGTVTWCEPFGSHYEGGLTFTRIADADQERIQSGYVESQGPF